MNDPMMAALQASRSSNPAPTGQPPVPGTPGAQPPQGGVSLEDIGAKLDKLISAISGQYQGTDKESEPVEEDEHKSGEAKTFK